MVDRVERVLNEHFFAIGLVHRDVEWRNIGRYKAGDGGEGVVVYDLSSVRERAVAGWIATHYHQTSDELTPQWNFDGMVEDAQLGFYVGLQVADAPALPTWNPGDEFEAARRRAIEALTAPRTPAPQAGAAPSAGDGTGESTDEPAVPAEPPSAPEPPSGRE
jgi:hypothetical protein